MNGEYLIRYVQAHESFRRPELEALAEYEKTTLTVLYYDPLSPFCTVQFGQPLLSGSSVSLNPSPGINVGNAHSPKTAEATAASLISRSVLSRAIFELWGSGVDYESLHADVKARTQHVWSQYQSCSFKFSFDTFCGKRSTSEQREIINSFSYMAFPGKIAMKNPDVEFMVMEEWDFDSGPTFWRAGESAEGVSRTPPPRAPKRIFLGRLVASSRRALIEKHDLKKRPYISTTSMDAELALVTAILALAAPGKLFLDPFVGTGGFMVSASELGALSLGSDIDGRSFRGKGTGMEKGVAMNFQKYQLESLFGDCIISDLTNTPFRVEVSGQHGDKPSARSDTRWLDGIISDPPYGVREGLKVLGIRNNKTSRTTTIPNATESPSSNHAGTISPPSTSSPAPISNAVPASIPAPMSSETLAMQPHLIDGIPAHTLPGYIVPTKPYSFAAMLHDILDFAADSLVDGGRLAFWMPTANPATTAASECESQSESDLERDQQASTTHPQGVQETPIPTHPALELKYVCTQTFNKWSRRLLVYERRPGTVSRKGVDSQWQGTDGVNADDLNPFRRMYFRGFQG